MPWHRHATTTNARSSCSKQAAFQRVDCFGLPDDRSHPCSGASFRTVHPHPELRAFYNMVEGNISVWWTQGIGAWSRRLDECLALQPGAARHLSTCVLHDTTQANKHTHTHTHTQRRMVLYSCRWAERVKTSRSGHDRASCLDCSPPREWTPLTHS